MMRARAVLATIFFLATSGCATTFYGSSNVSDGPSGCKAKCSSWGMELAGMVAMGEYSDGCICQVPSAQKPVSGVSGTGPAVAGVWIAMQAAAAAAAAQQRAAESTMHH